MAKAKPTGPSKLLLLFPLILGLVTGALGFWLLANSASKGALPPELANPHSAIAMPPPGAVINNWFRNALCEVQRDGSFLIFAGLLLVATLLRVVAPESQKRLRTSVFMFFIYGVTVPSGAVLVAAANLEAYAWIRGVALFCEGVAITNLVAIVVFDVIFATARIRIPPILRELLVGGSYLLVTLALFTRAGIPLGHLLTGSAVLTAVIGLSIQSTLGDLVSGVVLEWEDTIEVGDWVKVNDVIGKVKEIRWRHLTLETRNWETVVIPNSAAMKTNISILGRRTASPLQWRRWVYFQVPFRYSPNEVIHAVNEALQQAPIERVAVDPKPHCILYEFKEYAAYYAVRYWLTDIAVDDPTDSVIRTRVHFALARAGISMAVPERTIVMREEDDAARARETATRLEERLAALKRCNLFSMLKQDECYALVPHLRPAPFSKGEVMTRQGADAHWLYLLVKGNANVFVELEGGGKRQVATLKDGDYFGEMALLTGEKRSATVVAASDVECWRLDREGFKTIIERRPEMAQELASLLAARKVSIEVAKMGHESVSRADVERTLLHGISAFFGLSTN